MHEVFYKEITDISVKEGVGKGESNHHVDTDFHYDWVLLISFLSSSR